MRLVNSSVHVCEMYYSGAGYCELLPAIPFNAAVLLRSKVWLPKTNSLSAITSNYVIAHNILGVQISSVRCQKMAVTAIHVFIIKDDFSRFKWNEQLLVTISVNCFEFQTKRGA